MPLPARAPLAALFLALTFSAVAHAQTETPSPSEPAPTSPPDTAAPSEPTAAPPGTVAPAETPAPAAKPAPSRRAVRAQSVSAVSPGLRVAAELIGGAAGTAIGFVGALYTLPMTCGLFGIHDQSCIIMAYFALPVGGLVGAPIGAWLFGKWAGGEGRFLAALGGAALGAAVAIPTIFGAGYLGAWQLMPLAGLLPLAGAVIGYEWSHGLAQKVAFAPMPLPGGGAVAVYGVF